MNIKDLKEAIRDLPDNMEVMTYSDFEPSFVDSNYHYTVCGITGVKTRLVKSVSGEKKVQTRPFDDEDAVLVLIIE